MKTWLQLFLWRLLSRPFIRAVGWTDAERKQFELFYQTPCGRKLFEFLRQTVASATFNAVYRGHSVDANAHARGMQDVLALLHQLRSLPPNELANADLDEDVEPLPSQRNAVDGRRFNLGGGFSAIG